MQEFNSRSVLINHPDFANAMRTIERQHNSVIKNGDFSTGTIIIGESGAGKTTVCKTYRDRFPVHEEPTRRHTRVVLVSVPSKPTVKSLATAILAAVKFVPISGSNAAKLTETILKQFEGCGVEVMFLDEFQHFLEGNRNDLREVTNWLKGLIDDLHTAVFLCGVPSLRRVLQTNKQLRRRFSRVTEMGAFNIQSSTEAARFVGILQALCRDMPLPTVDFKDKEVATKIYFATSGLIDYMCKLINGAYENAVSRGAKEVALQDYAAAFKIHIWDRPPATRDPFSSKFNGALLDGPGEPFAPDFV